MKNFTLRAIGIVSFVVAIGCSGKLPNTDSAGGVGGSGGDAGGGAANLAPCSSSDYLKCDGNAVAHCTCTKNGPFVGNDLEGNPMYRCDAYSWVDDTVCSVACDATINPTSGCIASKQPIPECAQDGITCWNGDLTYCVNGYPLPPTPCAEGTQCTLVPGCQALC